jgi:hypothetical protein
VLLVAAQQQDGQHSRMMVKCSGASAEASLQDRNFEK